ncbi:hypothetical protein AAG570_005082 [Ranatra chinensis]|uniref:Major facilitator superfamily (MFS) profile domain-containing protein n=1 Tax=Ranatra chinensis TaxID=642074 RepID=A0ABD0Y112_9HEMI
MKTFVLNKLNIFFFIFQAVNSRLVFAIVAAAVGSSFQHGYNTGVVNAPQKLIEEWILDVKIKRSQAELMYHLQVTLIWAIAVSIFCVGGMIGGSIVGFVADKLGRKRGLLYNNILVIIAALLQGFAKSASSYEMLIAGRFVIGINAGLNAGLAPMYLAEISPVNLRGAVGTVYQLVITVSILISQILGLESILGTDTLWPMLLALTGVPAIFQVITLPLCPETPKHILQTTGNEIQAKQVLTWLRGEIDVHAEMEEMKAEHEANKIATKTTLREMLTNSSLRIPLYISVMLMIAQQFSGINAAIFYSTSVFMRTDLTKSQAQLATIGMGAVNVLVTIKSLILVEKVGRKTLLLIGFCGMFLSTLSLTVCLANTEIMAFTYMSIGLVFLFVMFFAVGPGSIPWFMVTELFTQNARPAATSIAVAVNWIANYLVGLGFLPLQQILGGYVFLIFATLQAFFIIFIFKKVPETKNKTTEEIAAMFRQISYQ